MDRNDAIPQHGILARAPRRAASRPRMIAAGGDAQNTAHRGHRMYGPVLAHESVSFGGTVFVSRANQAAARERMSRSTLSWRFSRRKRWSSWRSAEVNPSARRPSSRSACATQLRIVCAVGSNSRSNSSGVRPARTRSTICRRNSGAYGAHFLPLLGIGGLLRHKSSGVHETGSTSVDGLPPNIDLHDFIKSDAVLAPIVNLRGARRGMNRHLARLLQRVPER